MQLTIDSDDDLDVVLQALGAMFGVQLTKVDEATAPGPTGLLGEEDGPGVVKVRH